jgi:hypothetical protein
MATIYTVADQFKRELLMRERAASSALVHYYGEIWGELNERIQGLARQYYEAVGSGEPFSQAWLLEFERLQALRTQVEEQVHAFARFAERKITSEQQEAVWAALNHTEYMTGWIADQAGLNLTWSRLPVGALSQLIGTLSNGSPLRTLLWEYGDQAGQAVADGLMKGLALGQNPRVIARAIRNDLGGDLARALRISRTEVMRSYREASRESYLKNDQIIQGYIRRSARSARTCAACWAKDGEVYSLETYLEDHPNGRCFQVPYIRDAEAFYDMQDTGAAAFEKLSDEEQLNVLGPAKFEAYKAGEITLGDLVRSHSDPEWGRTITEASLQSVLGKEKAKYWIDFSQGRLEDNTTQAVLKALQPAGVPVSKALQVPGGKLQNPLTHALAMIDEAHGDGKLPQLEIKGSRSTRFFGAYRYYQGSRIPVDIQIAYSGSHKELTCVHEVGHFLDHMGDGDRRTNFTSQGGQIMDEWRDAVKNSRAIMELEKAYQDGHFSVVDPDGNPVQIPISREHARYLLSPSEIFARSYSEYVAKRTQDAILLRQVEDVLNDPSDYYPRLWDDDDFEPIAQAFDRLFEVLGWLK